MLQPGSVFRTFFIFPPILPISQAGHRGIFILKNCFICLNQNYKKVGIGSFNKFNFCNLTDDS